MKTHKWHWILLACSVVAVCIAGGPQLLETANAQFIVNPYRYAGGGDYWDFGDVAAAWTFDAQDATDDGPNSNDGTEVNGATYEMGRIGYALAVSSASSQYVTVPANSSLQFGSATDFTVSAWIKPDIEDSWFMEFGNSGSAGAWFGCRVFSGGELLAQIDDGSSSVFGASSGASMSTGTWYHVVYEFDRDGTVTFYVNTTNQGSTASIASVGDISSSTANVIGARIQVNVSYYNGLIDELFVYSRLLTSGERSTLYNEGSP